MKKRSAVALASDMARILDDQDVENSVDAIIITLAGLMQSSGIDVKDMEKMCISIASDLARAAPSTLQ